MGIKYDCLHLIFIEVYIYIYNFKFIVDNMIDFSDF